MNAANPSADAASPYEPIAVVGVSCRLPGAHDPAAYWELLSTGRDAVVDVPEERWPAGTAAGYRRAGLIDDVAGFDAGFFDIPPYEAAAMDPQHRLILELAWQALEDARIVPERLRSSATGVFIGANGDDYAVLHDRHATGSAYELPGTQRGVIAGRVSYQLGLRGPSLTVDTGQSSSLVAVHAACESLRRGETEVALAGGVNLALLPETTDTIGRFGALSPDGRCHVFDARANGYVRGEGGAVVVLKPLSAALAAGDPVLSVILGGAVNNDGGGAGLTVPDADAQRDVIRTACARAGITPDDVQYLELHGTGTPVGDPVEAAALGAALGAGRADEARLLVGSAKTNIGHLEGAAGVAGLLKVVLSIHHRRIAPTLHHRTPHPDIPLTDLGLAVADHAQDWPAPGRRLVAGVSSFGMGGTNCHLVLAELPDPGAGVAGEPGGTEDSDAVEEASVSEGAAAPWILSARSAPALQAQAAALADHLTDRQDIAPAAVAASLVRTRAEFERRAVVLGGDPDALGALGRGEPHDNVVTGTATPGRTAFLFPGQGTEWPGMARELLHTAPVFAARLRECCAALAPHLEHDLLAILQGTAPDDAPGLDRLEIVQPALWAVMVSLAALWESYGVTPDLVVGHSQGEIAAATVTGALSLADGALVVAQRARIVGQLADRGAGMLAVAVPRAGLRLPDGVSVAVVNGPRSTVLAGPVTRLTAFAEELESKGHRTRLLPIGYASHCALVEEVREELLTALAPVRPRATTIPFVSTVTGELLDTTGLDAAYWYANLRETVDLTHALDTALGQGCAVFVECGSHPVLLDAVEQAAEATGRTAAAVGTLRRDEGGTARFTRALAEAYVHGAPVDRTLLAPGTRTTALPTYAFQRERHWLDAEFAAPQAEQRTPRRPARELLRLITDTVGGVSGTEVTDAGLPFRELGLDSLGALELRRRIAAATGLTLPASLTYDFPTPQRLAQELGDRLDGAPRTPATPAPRARADADDPVVIVGMACRYPGGIASPEDLWRVVDEHIDCTSEFPTNRGWDLEALSGEGSGTSYVHRGGFLHDADEFDAPFFGVSPREAQAMDPQQRLLLATSWEALERAGIDPAGLRGSDTGVFAGLMVGDYGPRQDRPAPGTDGHLLTGAHLSVASGRIAYTFGFNGPAMSIDTACSSSGVALHLAVEALKRGECSLALAGGVTLMSRPGTFVEFSRQKGLSPDGRCKPFSATADGTAFAEGVGMLVVERLSAARRLGHTVLAVVRGTAVNHDGASNGLTAPNGPAQEKVVRRALAVAGLGPADIDVVEAHGTGTSLGDPVEAEALIATYGPGRPADRPLLIGSVKSNIGHTQAASGAAGIIKVIHAMRHGTLPGILHFTEPSPHVDWSAGTVVPLAAPRAWPEVDRPRRAAISSFGISGTNAHIIIEQPPAEPELTVEPVDDTPLAWPLSAATETSLRAQAARLHDRLTADPELRPLDVAHSLATTRARLDHRAVLLGRTRADLLAGLADLRERGFAANAATGTARAAAQTAFLFTGQGGQRPGMGRELHAAFPVFAAALDETLTALDAHLDRPLKQIMWAEPGTGDAALLDTTAYTQPALFAYQVAAFRLLESLGAHPDEVAGHSVGAIAAAHVAGVWNLADAARLVTARGRLMQALEAPGAMVAVGASHEEVLAGLAGQEHLWGVGAVNGPSSVVISGDESAVLAVAESWRERGRRVKRLTVSHAFHSPLMEPMVTDFAAVLDELAFHEPQLSYVPDLIGTVEVGWHEPAYWLEQVRRTVMFRSLVTELEERRTTAYVEVGPRAVLAAMTQECLTAPAAVTPLHRRDLDEADALRAALAEAHCAGVPVDLAALAPGGRRIDLPTYAFDNRRAWVTEDHTADVGPAGLSPAGHPLLRARIERADGNGTVATGRLTLADLPWLADHRMGGRLVVPGTAVLDLVLDAADHLGLARVEELTFEAPLILPEDGALHLQVAAQDGAVQVHSRTDTDGEWVRNASATVTDADADADAAPATAYDWATAWPPADASPADFSYDRLAETGYEYGPAFQAAGRTWRRGEETFAEVALTEGLTADGFGLHPVLLDAALHPYVAADPDGGLRLPFAFQGVTLAATGATALRVRLAPDGPDTLAIQAADTAGTPVLTAERLRVRALPTATAGPVPHLHRVAWEKLPTTPAAALTGLVTLDGPDDLDALAGSLNGGARPERVLLRAGSLGNTLTVVRRWLTEEPYDGLPLTVLTRDAAATGLESRPADPEQASVWGLLRTAQSENPGRFTLVDLDTPDAEGALAAALATGEPQLAVRGGELYVPRLAKDSAALALPDTPLWRLEAPEGGGSLDAVALVPCDATDRPLGAHEVRFETRAAGLNFRDVMITLGRMEYTAGLGWEAAGVVTDVGSEVTHLTVGDRVAGITVQGSGFAPVSVVDGRDLVRIPEGWSFVQAAAVPLAWVTAHYALVDLAGLKAGEKVLIHAAAGGVGMAAVQVARHLGAEVFGTASPGKWDTLRELGLDDAHIANSRDLEFEQRFPMVDVVLDSLAGEFVDASLRLLGDGGRFVEMGKTDIRDADEVAAHHPGVAYDAFDVQELAAEHRGRMLTEVLRLFSEGEFTPTPVTTWDLRRAPEALRYLSQARHTGKVVLTLPRPLNPDGTALITGATGTLGGLVARHLVTEHGARHLLLVGRRGSAADGMPELQAELEELGAEVTVAACDIADRDALAKLLTALPAGHPLTAVVHAAGVIDDGVLAQLTPERLEKVLRPKTEGARALHELTADHDLTHFVLFSSIAGIIGNAGQANYAAANAALDALAERRARAGLAATSIAWGLWDQESGMTGHLGAAEKARLATAGALALATEEGLALLDAAMAGPEPAVVASPWDLGALRARAARGDELPAPLRGLVRVRRRAAESAPTAAASGQSFADSLAGLDQDAARQRVTDAVRTLVAGTLGYGADSAVALDRAFTELGFDSLTSVELRNRIAALTGLRLPTTVVFDYPTPAQLSAHLHDKLAAEAPARPAAGVLTLDELEKALRGAAGQAGADDAVREGLVRVLRQTLAGLDTPATGPDTADGAAGTAGSAGQAQPSFDSDEEMFAYLDQQI
ncbi:type I polyketide synthase [Streptomyces sp. NPDC087425]|uniref:type I polyketide synthase n=1 Tax=Streptomyces sp. NPDC087425 TaxID=3365787 RepID=UPI0038016E35